MPSTTAASIRKKLIEVSIPLEAINAASAREKDIKVGKHTSIHQWFAPRPIATCRAVLLSQLVDDPSSWPERFPSDEAQDAERKRLHKVIERVVSWEATNDERLLNEARWEIARSVAWGLGEEPPAADDGPSILTYLQTKGPPVYDPFSGGGSIPLEAQRLGLRAYGSDLNPVAVLIGKSLVEIPPKFAGRPPVNPKARAEAANGPLRAWKGAQGLADDVRYYGQWMRDEAERRIGYLYPKATLPDGSKATVIAWLWARTVRSPDPAAKGAMVPLVSSFMLSTKEGKKAWIKPVIDGTARDGWRFEVQTGTLSKADEKSFSEGTKSARATFRCLLSGSNIGGSYIDSEAQAGRMSARLIAVIAEGKRSRHYLPAHSDHERPADLAAEYVKLHGDDMGLPNQECRGTFASNAQGRRYTFNTFADYFTPRQLIALTTLSDLVTEARAKVFTDAVSSGFSSDNTPLHSEGSGAAAYSDAVATYLSFVIAKNAQTLNSLVRWFSLGEKAQPTFERQAVSMNWDFAEANVLGVSTGSTSNCTKYVAMSIERWGGTNFGRIDAVDAKIFSSFDSPVISTDPPYYDNIVYSDLSDFFYVWHRRTIGNIWPSLFRRLTTPKDEELVATAYRHGGKAEAESFFMRGMGEAIDAMRRSSSDTAPLTIYYAFKQSEVSEGGITSAGWGSFLQGIIDAELVVDGTWPMRTEHSSKMISQGGANVLASSVVLVCRKRRTSADIITRADFIRVLKREMPAAIDAIRKAGVGPVDMQQSVIGPGMGVFSRHAKVLEDDDTSMSVKTALALINRVWEEIENELDQVFDPATQVALAWFATYGFEPRASGELITLTTAKNTSDRALFTSGVFEDLRGKTRLTPRDALPASWSPRKDRTLTVWECVQHTARVLNAPDGGGEAAAALVAHMGSKAEEARALVYRLFEIATQKGWAAEALVYNELAQEWTKLEDRASSLATAGPAPGPSQSAFVFGETA